MNWDLLDFIVFGAMIGGVAALYMLVKRRTGNTTYRIAAGVALVGTFLLLWINGAVGVIGDEGNDANMMFFGVLAVGFIGAAIARFRAKGMSLALYAMAGAQVLVAIVALAGQLGAGAPAWPQDVLFLTAFFVALWLLSGRLFSNAARSELRLGPGL